MVAQVIPARIVGIMACSDSIDIQAFHDFYILNHAFGSQYITAIRVHFMPVGTFNQYGFAVNKELGILNFNLTEAYFLWYHLDDISLTVFDNGLKRVEIWCFGRPCFDVTQGKMGYTVV